MTVYRVVRASDTVIADTDGQVSTYDEADDVWEPREPAGGGGGSTPGSLDATGVDLGFVPTAQGDDTWAWAAQTGAGGTGVTDHGALTGLGDDDHPHYALADGTRGAFAATTHSHEISGVTGLQAALDGKSDSGHTHTPAQVGVSNATSGATGLVQLTGDLGGTATSPTVRSASTTVAGKVELATVTEATTGTDTARAVTPAGLKAVADSKAAATHTHDDRYYTESEVDTALAGKANTSHTHGVTDLTAAGTPSATTYLRGDGAWATPAGGGSGGVLQTPRGIPYPGGYAWNKRDFTGSITSPTPGGAMFVALNLPPMSTSAARCEVNAAGAGASVILALYAPHPTTLLPDALIIAAGSASAETAGGKEVTFAPTQLPGGIVWVGLSAVGSAVTVKGGKKSDVEDAVPIFHPHDWRGPVYQLNTTSGVSSGAWPSTWTAPFTLTNDDDGPTVGLRVTA